VIPNFLIQDGVFGDGKWNHFLFFCHISLSIFYHGVDTLTSFIFIFGFAGVLNLSILCVLNRVMQPHIRV
jgi:hypothetical protein